MESLIHTIKPEFNHHEELKTKEEIFRKIFEYIEVFYNNERIHSSLDYATPNNYGIMKLVA
jgi:putative transposase